MQKTLSCSDTNLENKMDKKTAISLGNVCTSAVYGLREGLRPSKKGGYKTCPFDLMCTNIDGIIDCLNTDFKYFCDPKFLKVKDLGTENGEDRFMIRHTKYKWKFNHESFAPGEAYLYARENWENGVYTFVNNNFEKLVERYTKRIDNFKYYCESDYYVTFILQLCREEYSDGLMERLHDAIKTRFSKLEYEIKVISNDYKIRKK